MRATNSTLAPVTLPPREMHRLKWLSPRIRFGLRVKYRLGTGIAWPRFYVRQSSPQQVKDHKESGALQYELVRLATDLGWSRDRVEVIDEDQGTYRGIRGRSFGISTAPGRSKSLTMSGSS